MSDELIDVVQCLNILDVSCNLSDHSAVKCELQIMCPTRYPVKRQRNCKITALRWDKSNVYDYYCASCSERSSISVPVDCFSRTEELCTCSAHR